MVAGLPRKYPIQYLMLCNGWIVLSLQSQWETDFASSAGTGRNCASLIRIPNAGLVLDKNPAPLGPEILSSAGAESERRLLGHFQTAVLYWINSGLRANVFRSFEKGLADRGGWRKEIPPAP